MKILKFIAIIILVLQTFSCKTLPQSTISKTKLSFLSEYTFPVKSKFKGSEIGGLSGVDKKENKYLFAVDDASKPRILKASINIEDKKITNIIFTDVVYLSKNKSNFYKNNHLDLESVLYDESTNEILLTSEGSIKKRKNPLLFSIDANGNFKNKFSIPKKFLVESKQPRHNGTFEGLSHSFNKKGVWTAMEFPLKFDGEEPFYKSKKSYVRFTYYDKKKKNSLKEYAYELSSIKRPEKGHVNLNGLTDILEYKTNHFFVIERTYQSGYKKSNLVRIYEAIIDKNTTNTLRLNALSTKVIQPMKKRLLFDFEIVRQSLTDNFVDNIEGITFGPQLSNGNKTLLLVSDDNFQVYGKQLNQFILLEITE